MSELLQKYNVSQRETALIRKNGVVYTPQKLAIYLAHKITEYVQNDPAFSQLNQISIGDPACGDGILINSITNTLEQSKVTPTICGTDIDHHAITLCKKHFGNSIKNATFKTTNALCPFEKHDPVKGWKLIFEEAKIKDGFDILIANPPWGSDLSVYRNLLDVMHYSTLQGQVDSFELFIELAIKIVKQGGYFAFIVPDSILNHGKSIVRDILVTSTEIKFIARLGEKIFPQINRACVLIICKNSIPSENNMVDCFRLSSRDRALILVNKMSFDDAEMQSAHTVPQKRFANNPFKRFDIDLRENETALVNKLRIGDTLGEALTSTRGVELGSSGLICACKKCGTWIPLSEKDLIHCKKCKKKFNPKTAKKMSVMTEQKKTNSVPLIIGSDMKRYVCNPSRWITLGKKGINYKSAITYQSPKVLIRKTGVGITAALDYSSAYTNQVVYIFKKKQKTVPDLEFFIALINSRTYYFFLAKSFGELEWRSHPYLTQSQILSLPLPNIESENNKEIIDKIISLLKPILKKSKPSHDLDLEIELLIGKLFSLTKNDYKIIFNAINELDEMLPVKELKNIELNDILDQISR